MGKQLVNFITCDPLSPYLFIIGVELLSLKLKRNPDIQGITINDDETLLSQYADDTFLILVPAL
jgi:hypothetical protein